MFFDHVITSPRGLGRYHSFITINAPLILKMREIIFFLRANYIMGYFEGAKTFLTPKLSRAQRGAILGSKKLRPPQNIPRNGPLCSCPKQKRIISQIFKNQRCIGIFMSLCDQSPQFYHFLVLFFYFFIFIVLIKICGENPAKIPVWQKIRQSIAQLIEFIRATVGGTVNLHVFQVRLKQRKVFSHPPSSISPSTISPSNPSLSESSVSSSWSILLLKHKE
jgi:hypothetical protein